MEETTFKVDTGKGFNLSATLFLKSIVHSESIVIVCHGLLNTRLSETVRTVVERIPYHALSFDFQGNGLSEGITAYGNYEEEVENVRCIVSYVREKLERKVLCICGHSKGAAVVLLYASKYSDVPLIINISARYDHTQIPPSRFRPEQLEELKTKGSFVWLKLGNQDYVIRQEDMNASLSLDMSVVKNIDKRKIRVLTVHGSKDEVCPLEGSYTYDLLMGPKPYHSLTVIQGANHCYNNEKHKTILIDKITAWLNEFVPWSSNL
ncbi:6589_t:CDS:2 [Funneliformis geosporum]|uniref:7741_t:CDS:1 n=1 Tax=Funneliformis geosporum TaxID=1117311 RepID=A0A9W4SV75_9GLOM|nr:7741_t:CDS:2 [Funneliformis geosporum]CAI2184427.1 6589_t:CDS:2 [Funneliformis geosporum]